MRPFTLPLLWFGILGGLLGGRVMASPPLQVQQAVLASELQQAPASCQPAAAAVMARANAWRAEARQCGRRRFEAAAPLRWHEALQQSAQRFATELAARGELSHQGLSSPSLRERVRDSGYVLRAVGENLAAGPLGVDEVFSLWTSSEEHCANLMRADFEDMGLACVSASGRYERFWVLHLAAPARKL